MTKRSIATSSIALMFLFALMSRSHSDDGGLITAQSHYSVKETIARFAGAVKAKEALGFMVFTEIDHAAAAKKFGLEMQTACCNCVWESQAWHVRYDEYATFGDRCASESASMGG